MLLGKFRNIEGHMANKRADELREYPYLTKRASYREGGTFTHEGIEYDLDKALTLADRSTTRNMKASDLDWVLKYDTPDPRRVARADTSAPLLVSYTRDGRPTVIDGLHRLTKAKKLGKTYIPVRTVPLRDLRSAAMAKHASAPRDYKREYRLFHSSPEAKRNRAKRNLWNRRLKGKVPAGYEIDHKRQLRDGGGNGRDNIRFMRVSKNRAEHNRSRVVRDHMRKESSAPPPSELLKRRRVEVDRDKVRREARKTNKQVAGGIGVLLGGLAGSKLGRVGIAGGALGGGLLGVKAGTTLRPSDRAVENIARSYEKRINQDKLSDLELAGRGAQVYGGDTYDREDLIRKFAKTAAKRRKMTHVHPDKYNGSFRLGNATGHALAGGMLGGLIGGPVTGRASGALGGMALGAVGGGLLGVHRYQPMSDDEVYRRTERTQRKHVKPSLLARLEDVHPDILNADNETFLSEEDIKKEASVAVKRDPAKWEAAKREAKAKMGGKHSARAMQLATQIYKKKGGTYAGKKPSPSSNKLRKWTKQKWEWSGGDTPGEGGRGVYLPKRSTEQLSSTKSGRAKLRRASRIKRDATSRGQQFSSHGLHTGKKRSATT